MKPMKTMISVLAISAIAGTAAAGDFGILDTNANGEVDFQEYKTHAMKDGKSVTLAAQEFTSMTQGDATLTEGEFLIAEANASQSVDLDAPLIAAPMASETFETVAPAEIYVDAPQAVEAMESEAFEIEADNSVEMEMSGETMTGTETLWEDAPSEPMTSANEIDVETEVAGEIATSEEWTGPSISVPDLTVPEVVVEPEISLDADVQTDNDDIEVPQAPELPDAPVID